MRGVRNSDCHTHPDRHGSRRWPSPRGAPRPPGAQSRDRAHLRATPYTTSPRAIGGRTALRSAVAIVNGRSYCNRRLPHKPVRPPGGACVSATSRTRERDCGYSPMREEDGHREPDQATGEAEDDEGREWEGERARCDAHKVEGGETRRRA